MRIKNVEVTGLFGTFKHTIPLNLAEHATIVIGPNGFGKTTILKMLHGFFNGNFLIFFRIPFIRFSLELEDGSFISIEKQASKKSKTPYPFDLYLAYTGPKKSNSLSINLTEKLPNLSREAYYRYRSYSEYEAAREARNLATHGYSAAEERGFLPLLERYWNIKEQEENHDLPVRYRTDEVERLVVGAYGEDIAKIRTLARSINVHLIQAQRLTSKTRTESEKRIPEEVPSVKVYSDELVKIIAQKLAQSTEVAQKLDSTFPHRVISQEPIKNAQDTYSMLRDELQKLRNNRIHLKETGILVDLGGELEIPEVIEDENRLNFLNGVLAEYISDTKKKLTVFEEISDKIEILKRIINERFAPLKQLEINKDKGFVFVTPEGANLSPSVLSSGEQHELVLLYELLFKVPSGSLVLIDEPELSLHIAWQQKFMEDLLAITNIAKLDVLVATHAPDIIHNHWDLTVDLGTPANN